MLSRGFFRRRKDEASSSRIPPGQYLERGFPVLSVGPTPKVKLENWTFSIDHGGKTLASWSWDELGKLERTEIHVDIHCVTKWSKLDTDWSGVSFDTLFGTANIEPPEQFVMAYCDGGYTANLPVADITGGKGMLALEYDGRPLKPEHGGPVRLFVPHLYLWKSAKWVRGLRFMAKDAPGFWESYGYHMYGDPWKEQRYSGD